jgi:hypothetical protein
MAASVPALAGAGGRLYLSLWEPGRPHPAFFGPFEQIDRSRMAHLLSTPQTVGPASRLARVVVVGGVVLGVALLLAAAVLWLHYGSTVFFEMIASGFAACF